MSLQHFPAMSWALQGPGLKLISALLSENPILSLHQMHKQFWLPQTAGFACWGEQERSLAIARLNEGEESCLSLAYQVPLVKQYCKIIKKP